MQDLVCYFGNSFFYHVKKEELSTFILFIFLQLIKAQSYEQLKELHIISRNYHPLLQFSSTVHQYILSYLKSYILTAFSHSMHLFSAKRSSDQPTVHLPLSTKQQTQLATGWWTFHLRSFFHELMGDQTRAKRRVHTSADTITTPNGCWIWSVCKKTTLC